MPLRRSGDIGQVLRKGNTHTRRLLITDDDDVIIIAWLGAELGHPLPSVWQRASFSIESLESWESTQSLQTRVVGHPTAASRAHELREVVTQAHGTDTYPISGTFILWLMQSAGLLEGIPDPL